MKYLFLFLCTFYSTLFFAQQENEINQSKYTQSEIDSIAQRKTGLLTRLEGDSVVLRWMPISYNHWLLSREKGWKLIRITATKDNKTLIKVDTLNGKKPIKRWSKKVIEDNFAMTKDTSILAARTLMYDDKPQSNVEENFSDIMHGREQHSMLHLMALIYAAQSPTGANAMGLRYVDRGLDERYVYTYCLVSQVDTLMFAHDPSYAFVDPSLPSEIVNMPVIRPVGSEKKIYIKWSKELSLNKFIIYFIERSDDGKQWTRLTKEPYFPSQDKDPNGISPDFEYLDSVGVNYRTFYYRVIGVDDFGRLNYSPTAKGMALDKTPPDAVTDIVLTNPLDNTVKITWKKKTKEPDFAGYIVGRGDNVNGPFDPINKELISPNATEFSDPGADPHGSNFYVVAAVDTASNASMQMPSLAQMNDITPPTKPGNFKYSIDTSGVLIVEWDAYNERDFDGYLVLTANQLDHEFTPISKGRLMESIFVDTLGLKTLTKNIYYKVITFDKTNNASPYSDILTVTKPDIVPPVAPVIHNYQVSGIHVTVDWHPSTSKDVKSQALYRKEVLSGKDYQFLVTLEPQVKTYKDSELSPTKTYEYVIQATDSTGLKSEMSFPLQVTTYNNIPLKKVSNLIAVKDNETGNVHLTWDYQKPKMPVQFIVYRGLNNQITQYKYVTEPNYTDSFVQNIEEVNYAIAVIANDGTTSELSELVTIKIK